MILPTSKKRKKKISKRNGSSVARSAFNDKAEFQNKMMTNFPDAKVQGYHRSVSEMLAEFAKPLLETTESQQDTKNALEFSIIGWNLAVSKGKDPAKIEQILNSYVESYDESSRQNVRDDLNKMIARKEELFPEENIMIADYQLSFDEQGEMQLSVASLGPGSK